MLLCPGVCAYIGCPDILGLCRKPSGFGCNVADFSAQTWLWESMVGGSGVPALSPIGYSRHCSVLVRLSACLGLLCRNIQELDVKENEYGNSKENVSGQGEKGMYCAFLG